MLLTLVGHLTALSQSDSSKCFTVEEQRILVKKLSQGKACATIHNHLVNQLTISDSIITAKDIINDALNDKNELLELAYVNEKKALETSEKALVKSNRQRNRWRTLTAIVGASGIVTYILK